jgi:hypothetical protein
MKCNDYFFNKFTEYNSREIIYDLNEDWILEALSIVFEFIIIIMLTAVLIVSLNWFHEIHRENEAFLEMSISFLIGLLNGGRLDLKVFKAIDRQVIGISCLYKMGQ